MTDKVHNPPQSQGGNEHSQASNGLPQRLHHHSSSCQPKQEQGDGQTLPPSASAREGGREGGALLLFLLRQQGRVHLRSREGGREGRFGFECRDPSLQPSFCFNQGGEASRDGGAAVVGEEGRDVIHVELLLPPCENDGLEPGEQGVGGEGGELLGGGREGGGGGGRRGRGEGGVEGEGEEEEEEEG